MRQVCRTQTEYDPDTDSEADEPYVACGCSAAMEDNKAPKPLADEAYEDLGLGINLGLPDISSNSSEKDGKFEYTLSSDDDATDDTTATHGFDGDGGGKGGDGQVDDNGLNPAKQLVFQSPPSRSLVDTPSVTSAQPVSGSHSKAGDGDGGDGGGGGGKGGDSQVGDRDVIAEEGAANGGDDDNGDGGDGDGGSGDGGGGGGKGGDSQVGDRDVIAEEGAANGGDDDNGNGGGDECSGGEVGDRDLREEAANGDGDGNDDDVGDECSDSEVSDRDLREEAANGDGGEGGEGEGDGRCAFDISTLLLAVQQKLQQPETESEALANGVEYDALFPTRIRGCLPPGVEHTSESITKHASDRQNSPDLADKQKVSSCLSSLCYQRIHNRVVCKDVWRDLGGNGIRIKAVDPLFPQEWDQKPSQQPHLTVTFLVGAGTGRSPFPNIAVQNSKDIPLTMRLFQAVFAVQEGEDQGVGLFSIRACLLTCFFFPAVCNTRFGRSRPVLWNGCENPLREQLRR